jgi:gluconate 5-dehydrogenase/2-deoxy-D-gluconate 3-dehydrogenase
MKKPNFDLNGKIAIVVGGTQGIGKALALGLAASGCDVIPVSRTLSKSERVAEEIRQLGKKSLAMAVDITKIDDIKKLKDTVLEKFGKIDILVNAAGYNKKSYAVDLSEEDFKKVMSTNLDGVFLCSKVIGEQMIKQGGGRIINISSMGSIFGISRSVAYCASKGGVSQLTKVLAIEWSPYNINVNAIAPGWFKTELTTPVYTDPVASKRVVDKTPVGRWGEVDELVGATIFLASEASSFVTGTTINVDGGFSILGI